MPESGRRATAGHGLAGAAPRCTGDSGSGSHQEAGGDSDLRASQRSGRAAADSRDKTLVLPLYLERSQANRELANFQKGNPQVKAQVLALPLNIASEKIEELNKQLKDGRTLVAPVVSREQDRKQAIAILKKQGLSDKQVEEGLTTPVFFTKPLLTINTPQGARGVFFFRYDDMEKALAGVQDSKKLEPQAADLTAVLREIIKAKDDVFIFFPTPEYFALVKEQQQQQGGSAAPSRPAAP